MSETVVRVRASRARVLAIIRSVPAAARQSSTVLREAGNATLRRVEKAFYVKSRGGTDETGERWAPLSRLTVAKRMRRANRTSDRLRPSSRLTPEQREKWWNFYRSALARYHDKSTAAKIAWSQMKQRGASGYFDKYSFVLILRDTDTLLRSLMADSNSPHKVFRLAAGQVEIGTDRKGATAHHSGAKNLPQRRLWPHPRKWTSAWWQEVLLGARDGVVELIVEKLQ